MIKIRKITVLLLTVFFCGTATYAQTGDEVSDKELNQFVSAVKEVQVINQEAQEDMVKSVEESELDIQRFNEIYTAMQDQNTEVDTSDEEMEKFNKANAEIINIQTEAQQKMEKEILDQDMAVERYQEINMQIQNDPALMQKVQKLLQGEG